MARKLLGSVAYQPVVETVSRKFTTRKNVAHAASAPGSTGRIKFAANGWMGGMVRRYNLPGIGECFKNCLVIRESGRTSAVKPAEIQLRALFASVARGKNHILHDLMQLTQVQTLYNQARDTAGTVDAKKINGVSAYGYTLSGWVFAVQYAGAKAATEQGESYNYNQFPTSFDA